jgi:hypothetical protein
MKWWLILWSLSLVACGGEFWLTPVHHVAYKSKDGQLSCHIDNCCWPYKEKFMICTQASGINGGTVYFKYYLDK